MDDAEFKRRLSEVAEWKIPDTPRETSLNAKKKRGRKTNEEIYQNEHEEIFLEIFDGVNPTYPPMLTRVKVQGYDCDDCGDYCPNGRKKEKKLYETGKTKNWRERCLTCEKSKNPFTGKFDLTISEASRVWTDFLRETKGIYKTNGNEKRKELLEKLNDPNATVIENDEKIIIIHSDNQQKK